MLAAASEFQVLQLKAVAQQQTFSYILTVSQKFSDLAIWFQSSKGQSMIILTLDILNILNTKQ